MNQRIRYCTACKARCTVRVECNCTAPKLGLDKLIPLYHHNSQSGRDTQRILERNGYKYGLPTITEFINAHSEYTTPEMESRKRKRERDSGAPIGEDNNFAYYFSSESDTLISMLPDYISQRTKPVFPAPISFVLVAENVSRYKAKLEKFLRVRLP